jgi:hypothetical protein
VNGRANTDFYGKGRHYEANNHGLGGPRFAIGLRWASDSGDRQWRVRNWKFQFGPDWTPVTPYDQYLFVSSGGRGYGNPNSGNYFAVLAGYTVPFDSITQTVSTIAGQQYDISFSLRTNGDASSHADEFIASFGNVVLLDDITRTSTNWAQHSFTATATSNTTTLEFSGVIGDTFWGLDDVSVTASGLSTPVPSSLVMSSILFGMFGAIWSYQRLKQTAAVA